MKVERKRLSEVLHQIFELSKKETVTFQVLLRNLDEQSHAFLMSILCLPFMLPIPLPGLSTIFGTLMVLMTLAWTFDLPPWIPKKLRDRPLPEALIEKGPYYAERVFTKIEFFLHPRGVRLFEFYVVRILIALVIIACALFLALPLPPGTNFPPALIIFLMCLGILERDALAILVGLVLFVAACFLLQEGITYLREFLQSLGIIPIDNLRPAP